MATRILIIEDEAEIADYLRRGLAFEGYAVELAASGMEALERLDRPGIDLLLLDVQLGDLDGVQVLRAAREHVDDAFTTTRAAGISTLARDLRHNRNSIEDAMAWTCWRPRLPPLPGAAGRDSLRLAWGCHRPE